MQEEARRNQSGQTLPHVRKVTNRSSWYQRHQGAMAVLGTVLALTSYLLKERVAETWQQHVTELREAKQEVAREQQAARTAYEIGKVHAGVNALFDTARVEQKRRSLKTNDEQEPEVPVVNSTLDEDLDVTLPLADAQQSALDQMGSLLPVDNTVRRNLQTLDDALGSIAARYTAQKTGGKPSTIALLADMQAVILRQGSLRIDLEAEASAAQKRDEKRAAWVSIAINVLFALGLVLSLIGKLGGADGDIPEG